jgi:hypothetical protein
MAKKFTRKIEDFKCENCGTENEGNGYTNHCFNCLWSKHVDVNPGDRMSLCGGMMKPIDLIQKGKDFFVLQKCLKCNHERKNKIIEKDNFKVLLSLSNSKY